MAKMNAIHVIEQRENIGPLNNVKMISTDENDTKMTKMTKCGLSSSAKTSGARFMCFGIWCEASVCETQMKR